MTDIQRMKEIVDKCSDSGLATHNFKIKSIQFLFDSIDQQANKIDLLKKSKLDVEHNRNLLSEELQVAEREHEKSLIALEQEIEGWKCTNRFLKVKIEIAEKALDEFTEKHFHGGSKANRDDYVSLGIPTSDIYKLREALKAIRE